MNPRFTGGNGEYPDQLILDGKFRISISEHQSKSYIKVEEIPLVERARFQELPTWLKKHIIEHGDDFGSCPPACPHDTVCTGMCVYINR